ncbi:MAG: NUDIX domain-containing protein [Candidatus Paceibacter sp.]|nr:NUDIX domain-containing protein [Candidatus Paceibacter sp.]
MIARKEVSRPSFTSLIIDRNEIRATLGMIISNKLDFVALGFVGKTPGRRILVCEAGYKDPLLKAPGGRPEIDGDTTENPLDTVSREISEETGVITYYPEIGNIFLIQKVRNREGKYYYMIAFELKYFSGDLKKGAEVAELKEFGRKDIYSIINSKKMVPLHVPIWKYYLKNCWE